MWPWFFAKLYNFFRSEREIVWFFKACGRYSSGMFSASRAPPGFPGFNKDARSSSSGRSSAAANLGVACDAL